MAKKKQKKVPRYLQLDELNTLGEEKIEKVVCCFCGKNTHEYVIEITSTGDEKEVCTQCREWRKAIVKNKVLTVA